MRGGGGGSHAEGIMDNKCRGKSCLHSSPSLLLPLRVRRSRNWQGRKRLEQVEGEERRKRKRTRRDPPQ